MSAAVRPASRGADRPAERAARRPGITLAPEVPAGIETGDDGYTSIETQIELTDWRELAGGLMRSATFTFEAQASPTANGASVNGTGCVGVQFYAMPSAGNATTADVTTSAKLDLMGVRAEDIEVLAAGFAQLARSMRAQGVFGILAEARGAE